MKEYIMKSFVYRCQCGYVLNVFVDYGTPQDMVRCRKCSGSIKRLGD